MPIPEKARTVSAMIKSAGSRLSRCITTPKNSRPTTRYAITLIEVIAYLVVGRLFFGVVIHLDSLLPALLIIALTVLAFSGIGILSAAFVLYLKRGDPITYLVASGSALVGGVFYPPEDMPRWLGGWSHFLPITYALHALRRALLRGSRFADLLPDIRALVVFAAVLLPLG